MTTQEEVEKFCKEHDYSIVRGTPLERGGSQSIEINAPEGFVFVGGSHVLVCRSWKDASERLTTEGEIEKEVR